MLTCARRGRAFSRISFLTFTAIIVMFGLALSLWMIDIHQVILVVQEMILSDHTNSLQDVYMAMKSKILRFALVEDALYAYMVFHLSCVLSNGSFPSNRRSLAMESSSGGSMHFGRVVQGVGQSGWFFSSQSHCSLDRSVRGK